MRVSSVSWLTQLRAVRAVLLLFFRYNDVNEEKNDTKA